MTHNITIKIWERELNFEVDTDKDPLLEENLRRAADIINDRIRTMVLDYNVDIQDVLSLLLLSRVKDDLLKRSDVNKETQMVFRELDELDRDLEEYLSSR